MRSISRGARDLIMPNCLHAVMATMQTMDYRDTELIVIP